ncbi:hypothetical protein BGZ95_003509, partial [Linnemannia exigua]
MSWAGDSSVLIDRFDGRALLDYLPMELASVVDSGLRPDWDEDGIGNELRFERWHDLADKIRLHIPEEQCVLENDEEWNDLVVRHHALIGKVSEKKRDNNTEGAISRPSFGYDYGTSVIQPENTIGQAPEKELTALEEENIFDHLDDLTARERDSLDSLGKAFFIKDYFWILRVAKEEEDERVNQLKVTAVNLERALAGKKPLKTSEIEGLADSPAKNQGRGGQTSRRHRNRRRRSRSPSARGARRTSPSYEPYQDSSSRSGTESPSKDKVEFIHEFKIGSPKQDNDSGGDYDYYGMVTSTSTSTLTKVTTSRTSATTQDAVASTNQPRTTSNQQGVSGIGATKSSLAQKLKQRMRQGLEQSVRSHDAKKQAKDQGDANLDKTDVLPQNLLMSRQSRIADALINERRAIKTPQRNAGEVAVVAAAQGQGTGVAVQAQRGSVKDNDRGAVGIIRKGVHSGHHLPGDQEVGLAALPGVIRTRIYGRTKEAILDLDLDHRLVVDQGQGADPDRDRDRSPAQALGHDLEMSLDTYPDLIEGFVAEGQLFLR